MATHFVGERRNFCFAEIRRPDPLARLCTSAWLYGKFKPRHFERAVAFLWACEQKFRHAPTSEIGLFFVLSYNGCNRGLVSSTGERCSPLQICCRGVRVSAVYILFSSFKQGAGSAFLCDQNLSSCSPNSRWQNVSSYTVAPQGFRFVVKPLLLIHEKWVFCCRKNATIAEMLPN